jgi:hypothetical protein
MKKTEADRPQQTGFKPEEVESDISNRQIAQRAYEIYEQRDGMPGSEFDDWLQAERELRDEKNSDADQAA